MKTAHPIRLRLFALALLVMTAIGGLATAVIMTTIDRSSEEYARSRRFSAVQLVKLYIEMSAPGDWSVRDNRLYKGDTPLVEDDALRDALRHYLERGTTITFGTGKAPASVDPTFVAGGSGIDDGGRGPGAAPESRPAGTPPESPPEASPPSGAPPEAGRDGRPRIFDMPIATETGAYIVVADEYAVPVGWIAISNDGPWNDDYRDRGRLRIILWLVLGNCVIVTAFGLVMLRATRPIETIVEARNVAEGENAALAREARTDPLTGLLNRRGLEAELAEACGDGPSHVAVLDIDHFKRINDRLGHDAGDRALVALAGVLSSHVRPCDLCCRWGGEEFVVAWRGMGDESAACSAERLRAALEALELSEDGEAFRVTATIGLAPLSSGCGFEAALDRADEALYRGKRAGRNRVVVAAIST